MIGTVTRRLGLLIVGVFSAFVFMMTFVPATTSAIVEPPGGGGTPLPAGSNCRPSGGTFLGFPTWYKYLGGTHTSYGCVPRIGSLSQIWLVGLAILEILLRLAALLAIAFVVYGGIKYIVSQGDPSGTKQAKDSIINAIVGLVIAVSATAIISFVGGRFT